MTRSLMTGISGLRSHQQQLDVVANNLANMNTTAFKSQSVAFSDLIYQNLRSGGGLDPQAVGTGVQISRISRRFTQGPLESTGQIFDFAIQGEGFFTLVGPSGEHFYTRDGSFALDDTGRLIDPSTGYYVRRFGDSGEAGSTGSAAFQTSGDDSILVPLGAAVAGSSTSNIDFSGNLPSTASPPSAQVLSSSDPFESSPGVAALGTTLLSDLTINQVDYIAGDLIQINGTNPDGTSFSGSLAADGATLGDLINEINSLATGATASLATDGTVQLTSDTDGESVMTLVLADDAANTGRTNFSGSSFIETTEGTDGDTFQTSFEVYDTRGETHRINLEFRKTSANTWNAVASISANSGTMIDDSVFDITFTEDGSFALAGATGVGDTNIEIDFNSIASPFTVTMDFQALSHLATDYTVTQQPDGFPSGTIVSIAVDPSGELSGLGTNGRTIPLAQLAIARFSNADALNPIGNNQFQQTINAGLPSVGEGSNGGRGSIVGGQLEASNVDIAQEFTRLIVAQRGFSANARTITVADEMLEELTNIIR